MIDASRTNCSSIPTGTQHRYFLCNLELLPAHAVIPFEEFLQRATVIEVIEKGQHRHARAFEDQRAAHHLRMRRENVRHFAVTWPARFLCTREMAPMTLMQDIGKSLARSADSRSRIRATQRLPYERIQIFTGTNMSPASRSVPAHSEDEKKMFEGSADLRCQINTGAGARKSKRQIHHLTQRLFGRGGFGHNLQVGNAPPDGNLQLVRINDGGKRFASPLSPVRVGQQSRRPASRCLG